MAYKYHPEIEGLKTNEDGSKILHFGDKMEIKKMNRRERPTDALYVNLLGKTFTIAKLVCECWNGMAENPRWYATRREKEKGFHYTNLYWAARGTNPQMSKGKTKRSSWSKISKEDIPNIEERLENKETLKAIAADYDTTDMSISRIKKKFEKRKNEEVKNTKTE